MTEIVLDVVATRGDLTESVHHVSGVLVNASGEILMQSRDYAMETWWRSCAKPFQLLPLLESGVADELGWGSEHFAIACGSHGGEPEHVELVESMLKDLGLDDGHLACGPHEPLSSRGAEILRQGGTPPRRVHNNCSGKHAAMLAAAVRRGWPPSGYQEADHEVQQHALKTVALWSGVAEDKVQCAVDGCGVPVFGTPLTALAQAFARLGDAARRGDAYPQRVVEAMGRHPFLVGGTARFDTIVMDAFQGRVISKVGAEGVHVFSIPEAGLGGAVKVHDGALRAQQIAVLQLLLDAAAPVLAVPDSVKALLQYPIRNTRGETVGELMPVRRYLARSAASGRAETMTRARI